MCRHCLGVPPNATLKRSRRDRKRTDGRLFILIVKHVLTSRQRRHCYIDHRIRSYQFSTNSFWDHFLSNYDNQSSKLILKTAMSAHCDLTDQNGSEVSRRPSLSRKMQRSFRKVKKSIQRITESIQDEERHQSYVLPERLSSLIYGTGFSKEEIQRIYRAFKQYCPRGTITASDLKPAYAKFFPLGDSAKYAQMVFNTFDKDKDGIVTFGDLLLGIATIVKGSTDEKLSWIFRLYDLNDDGCISKHELTMTISAIYEMVHNNGITWSMVNRHVDRVLEKMDIDKDGMISKEEFIASCKNDVLIQSQLTEFSNFWW